MQIKSGESVELAEIIIPDLRAPMRPHTERVLRSLKVEERGRDDGLRNFPESAAEAPTQCEEEIHAEFKAGGADALNTWVEKALQRATEGVHAIDLSAEEKEPGRIVDDTIAEVRKAIADGKEEVAKARAVERAEHRERRHFKDEHELHRAARYPKSRVLSYCILLTIAISEALLNTFFLAPTNPNGGLGGFMIAVGVAVLNVGGAYLAGAVAIPNLFHRSSNRRYFGVIGLIALALFAVALNTIVAHYRFAVELLGTSEGSINALQSFRTDALGFLDNLESAALFALGLISWTFCVLKSTSIDDKYPGYGRADREYCMALHNYEISKKALGDNANAILRAGLLRIDGLVSSSEGKFRSCTGVLNRAMAVIRIGRDSIEALNNELVVCLKTYRETNRRIRTSIAPTYFDAYPQFELRFAHAPEAMLARHRQFEGDVGVVRQRGGEARSRLHSQIEGLLEAAIRAIEDADQIAARRLKEDQEDNQTESPVRLVRSAP